MSYTLSSADQSSPMEDLASSGKVFALLRPANAAARKAYDATLKVAADHPTRFGYANRYVQSEPGPVGAESGSAIGDDEDVLEFGSFKFSLDISPSRPWNGWYLGIGWGDYRCEGMLLERPFRVADILLGPPTVDSQSLGLEKEHARIFLDPESGRVVLEARHSLTIGRDVTKNIQDSAHHVLEHNEQISIGDCVYVFEHTNFFNHPTFRDDLSVFLKAQALPPLPVLDARTLALLAALQKESDERMKAQWPLGWGQP
ncbi:hypothetical protein MMC14_005829 [Varicellaria rhodocarpa]|nr:hypothetical protein [Varicellaria rhodocarpa]